MRVAICGHPVLALQLQIALQNSGIEFRYFVTDFVSIRCGGGGNLFPDFQPITFFGFRRLVDAGELDGLIIVDSSRSDFTQSVVQVCKFYGISKIIVADLVRFNPFNPLYLLDKKKAYIGYLETNIIDACNLNCKGCTHFAGLFDRKEIYPLEIFWRDVRRVSEICDVGIFRLMGGEPLLLEDLDEYIKIARQSFPRTNLRIVTNGLLIPSLPQKILDAMRKNNCVVDISAYKPTLKIANKIREILSANEIPFDLSESTKDNFGVFMTLQAESVPEKSRAVCFNNGCRFLRDGKIYKCPLDALSYRFAEKFALKNYPHSTGVDIYAENFAAMIPMLDGNVELCHWCSEKCRRIPWEVTNKPKLEDWLANPHEIKKLQ